MNWIRILRLGDLRIFKSEKKPIKKINKTKILNCKFSFGKKTRIVIKSNIPPEKGGFNSVFVNLL